MKTKLLWILVICVAAMGIFFAYGTIINQTYQGRAWSIAQIVSDFISENEGCFPQNQQELIDNGYIKVEFENGIPRYYVRAVSNHKNEWQEWPVYLERFEISYGAQINDFIVKDKKLYKRGTNEQIFLLNGPYNRKMEPSLRRMYNLISLKWHEEMKRASRDNRTEADIDIHDN